MDKKPEAMFKRGEMDFKTVLNKQIDRILEKLTEGEIDKFSNGVEGLYLVLFYYLEKDTEFIKADQQVMEAIKNSVNDVVKDLRIQPEDKDIRVGDIGIQASKLRMALIDRVLGKRRLLLESRRAWDERGTPGEPGEGSEPTEEELERIINPSSEEK
jgi:hypothetical protein